MTGGKTKGLSGYAVGEKDAQKAIAEIAHLPSAAERERRWEEMSRRRQEEAEAYIRRWLERLKARGSARPTATSSAEPRRE